MESQQAGGVVVVMLLERRIIVSSVNDDGVTNPVVTSHDSDDVGVDSNFGNNQTPSFISSSEIKVDSFAEQSR